MHYPLCYGEDKFIGRTAGMIIADRLILREKLLLDGLTGSANKRGGVALASAAHHYINHLQTICFRDRMHA